MGAGQRPHCTVSAPVARTDSIPMASPSIPTALCLAQLLTVAEADSSMGMVFRLKPNRDGSWTYRKIHTFIGEPGSQPIADLTLYGTGLLYGTTFMGGLPQSGVMFKLAHNPNDSWSYTVPHVFLGRPGKNPESQLIRDKAGKLYGTTTFSDVQGGKGIVFEFTP
jgi:hypothetical protein